MKPKTQRHLKDRKLNQARSKPDTVDRPVRTARTFVHHYNSTHYCNTETVFFNIPLPADRKLSVPISGFSETVAERRWP